MWKDAEEELVVHPFSVMWVLWGDHFLTTHNRQALKGKTMQR